MDFWASWCSPCRSLSATMEVLDERYAGKLLIAKVNIDENISTKQRLKVTRVPTIHMYKDGQLVYQTVGNTPKHVLIEELDKHLGG